MDSSSVTDKIESGNNNNNNNSNVTPMDKKRKSREGSSSMTSAHSKVIQIFHLCALKLFIFLINFLELGLIITLFFSSSFLIRM